MPELSGVWKFNETITESGWAASADATKEYINFTAYKNDDVPTYQYIGFNLQHYYSGDKSWDNLQFLKTSTSADMSYVWAKPSTATYGLGWSYEKRRTVDFGSTPQTVSEEFYAWFTANAVQRTDLKPIYKRVDGAWVKQTAYRYDSAGGEWVQISAGE